MEISPHNKTLYEILKQVFHFSFFSVAVNDEELCFCNDLDSLRYEIVGGKDVVYLRMIAVDLSLIWQYSEKYFKTTYYPDLRVGVKHNTLEITVDKASFEAYSKTINTNETGKERIKIYVQAMAGRLSLLKRDFFSCPYEMMLGVVGENARGKQMSEIPNMCYRLSEDGSQKVWVCFEGKQMTVHYGVSFVDRIEQQLCRVFFLEMVDAKKHVPNAPSVSLSEEMPHSLFTAFPNERKSKFTNGVLSVTIYGSLVRETRTMGTYLCSLRSYAYYHVQASKCYLHSRVLRHIQSFGKSMMFTKLEQETP